MAAAKKPTPKLTVKMAAVKATQVAVPLKTTTAAAPVALHTTAVTIKPSSGKWSVSGCFWFCIRKRTIIIYGATTSWQQASLAMSCVVAVPGLKKMVDDGAVQSAAANCYTAMLHCCAHGPHSTFLLCTTYLLCTQATNPVAAAVKLSPKKRHQCAAAMAAQSVAGAAPEHAPNVDERDNCSLITDLGEQVNFYAETLVADLLEDAFLRSLWCCAVLMGRFSWTGASLPTAGSQASVSLQC